MAAKFPIDGDAIQQLAKILVDTHLTEIEYEVEGSRIRVSRGSSLQTAAIVSPTQAIPSGAASESATASADHPGTIKSPMVGTAYMSAEPGAAPFVKVGDTVSVGQTLMIIEAMKVMNPLKATTAGKILKIFAQDAAPVEYGEPLMIIE